MGKRVVKVLVGVLVWAVDYFAVLVNKCAGIPRPQKWVILYYHEVKTDQIDAFAKQMDRLPRAMKIVPLDAESQQREEVPCVSVTFDDGFSATLRNVLPVLEERDIPVTIFVPSGLLGKSPKWIRRKYHSAQDETVIDGVDLKRLSNHPLVSIGSHCVSHRSLLSLEDVEARAEITESKRNLEIILGKEVKWLSYPYGEYASRHVRMAEEAGYENVYSINPMTVSIPSTEYVIGRVRVDPTDWDCEYWLKVRGAYNRLPNSWRNLRRFLGIEFHD